ncbi:MAG: hypothetical protein PHE20_02330 [Patescibacteria group bacterium]|nr:hypothetical protein [Patescibacteria group bacterium]
MSVKSKINLKKTSKPSPFLERPLPDEYEVELFEQAIKKEVMAEEMDNNLSAIYHDKKGNLIDVSKMKKRKRLRLIVLFKQLFVLTIFVSGIYGVYYYYFNQPASTDSIFLEIKAPEKALVREPISYNINYRNDSGIYLSNVKLEIIPPSSFIQIESAPLNTGINSWSLGDLDLNASGTVTISGYLVAPADSANVIVAKLNYTPANFSSEFRKESSANTVISGIGFNASLDYLNTALVGQNNELKINSSNFQGNNLSEYYIEIIASDNFKIKNPVLVESDAFALTKIEPVGERKWLLSSLPYDSEDKLSIPISFALEAKNQDSEELSVRLYKKETNGRELIFWEKTVSFEVMKSDLNIGLSLNGEKTDQAVNFGDSLNYSLSYSNNGDSSIYDLVLMAVVKGDFVDWSTLEDNYRGSLSGDAIMWTKEDVPALGELKPGQEGKIDFSLKVNNFNIDDLASETFISSYAQYNLNNNKDEMNEDNRSNTIKSAINSDLSLVDKVLYFNEDNLPVGSGPLPPKVNEQTTVRVYWTIKNNLHDLENVEVYLDLPVGVNWSDNDHTNVGTIQYDAANRQVIWRLGLLPLSVYRADAEFSLSVTPNENDRNKILVLSPGAIVVARDKITGANLRVKTGPRTTKLEDDDIAGLSNNGRVE